MNSGVEEGVMCKHPPLSFVTPVRWWRVGREREIGGLYINNKVLCAPPPPPLVGAGPSALASWCLELQSLTYT